MPQLHDNCSPLLCIHAGALAHKRASMQGEAHLHTLAHLHKASGATAQILSDHVLTKWLPESNLNCTVCSHDHHVRS